MLPAVQVPTQLPAVQVGTAKEPQTGAMPPHEAFVPPLLPVHVQVPAATLYPDAVPAVQVSAAAPQVPLTAGPHAHST
jgi:hypothetical protein